MALLFINKVQGDRNAFEKKVKDISSKLGIDPNWLMAIMNYESAGTFSPSVHNGGATGLIQFLPSTAIGLGTTTDALANMTGVQQLDYVYEYLRPHKGQMIDYYSTYLAIFYPAALGMPDTYVFPQNVVSANPSFFKTGHTLGDYKTGLDSIIYAQVPTAYYDEFFKKKILFCRSIKEKLSEELQLSYC